MKASVLFVMLVTMVGLSYGVCAAQPDCTNVYLKIYDPVSDPPCGDQSGVTTGWFIHVTSSPSSVNGGTCSTFSLNQLYADVDFFNTLGCGTQHVFTCDIAASSSILSGYYELDDLGDGCFRVCETCTP